MFDRSRIEYHFGLRNVTKFMQLRLKTIVNSRNVHEWHLYMVIEDYTAVEKKKLVTTVFWLNLYYSSIVALFPENRIVFFNIWRKSLSSPIYFWNYIHTGFWNCVLCEYQWKEIWLKPYQLFNIAKHRRMGLYNQVDDSCIYKHLYIHILFNGIHINQSY